MVETNGQNYEINNEANMIPVPVGTTVVTQPVQPVMQEAVPAIPVETLVEEAPVEKPYTFRKLSSKDVFLMFKIISKIGINEFTACFGKEGVINMIKSLTDKEKADDSGAMLAAATVGLEIGNVILANIGECENEVYKLLAQTSNMTVEEITADGNALLFVEMVIDFVKKDEFPDFIKVVSKLFK